MKVVKRDGKIVEFDDEKIRKAIGRANTPDLYEIIQVLGEEEVKSRLSK